MDQNLRNQLMSRFAAQREMYSAAGSDHTAWDFELIRRDADWLKSVIATAGWPVIALVGKDGAQSAWQIVQVADSDPEFQEYCLALMKAAQEGEALLGNVAYLEDRIRSRNGLPQLYGTQHEDTATPILDPSRLDCRRREAGLVTYDEELAQIRRTASV